MVCLNNLEILISEFEDELIFSYRKDMPEYLPGLIVNTTVYVNSGLPPVQAITKIAEEIGHYSTSVEYNLIDYSNLFNWKQEKLARNWSYKKLVPINKLKQFVSNKEVVQLHEIAEEFEVPEDFIDEAINSYKEKGYI